MKDKTVAVVQARMDSTRLFGKSLKTVGEWSLIELVLKRVAKSSRIDTVVLATSTNPKDDILHNHVKQLGFPVFRGSEDDVLTRFYEACKLFEPTIVVRITGDCPLISPSLIDHAIHRFLDSQVDYLSLSIGEDKERAYPRGFDVEITNFASLKEAVKNATEQFEREHVMPYLYTHPESYTVDYVIPESEYSRPQYRLCVDTNLDLELILKLYDFFKGKLIDVDYKEIIEFLDNNPQLARLNKSVKQKHFKESDSKEA